MVAAAQRRRETYFGFHRFSRAHSSCSMVLGMRCHDCTVTPCTSRGPLSAIAVPAPFCLCPRPVLPAPADASLDDGLPEPEDDVPSASPFASRLFSARSRCSSPLSCFCFLPMVVVRWGWAVGVGGCAPASTASIVERRWS